MSESEEFLKSQKQSNPDRFQEVADKYAVNTPYGEKKFYYDKFQGTMIDHSPERKRDRKRQHSTPDPEKPKSKKLDPNEWEDYRKSKQQYERDWLEEYYYAKELADQGM